MVDLKTLQADPSVFRESVVIPAADGRVVRFGDVCEAWQSRDFTAMDVAWQAVVNPGSFQGPRRAWLERPRGHSKTSDLAVMVAWTLFASRRAIRGVAAAADQDQARILRDCVASLVEANGWLSAVLDVAANRVANRHTGSTLQIITSDVGTSYGLLCDFIVADEVTHWRDRGLWDSLVSTAAKRPHCLLVAITNAGFSESWQYQARQVIRGDPAWLFSRLDGPVASWITGDALAEQERLLPAIAYRRLWCNEWSEGAGDALEASLIDQAVRLPGPQSFDPGMVFVGGLDLSLSRDASAMGRWTCTLTPI